MYYGCACTLWMVHVLYGWYMYFMDGASTMDGTVRLP